MITQRPASLRAHERLRLTKRFLEIRRRGVWAKGQLLSVGTLPNGMPNARLGLRLQRGLKGSVARNRVKRLARTVYQRQKNRLRAGYDVLIVIHRTSGVSSKELQESFIHACNKIGLFCS